jgi:hypothetical protein
VRPEGEEGVPEDGMHFAVDLKTGHVVSMDGRRPRGPVGDAEGRAGSGGSSPTALLLEGELQLPAREG